MASCPNKNHPDWKNLVSKVGEDLAYFIWDYTNGNIETFDYNILAEFNKTFNLKEDISKNDKVSKKNDIELSIQRKNQIKQIFEENPELANIFYNAGNNNEQQAIELFNEYLNSIFPDSKVKDIVYHGADEKIEYFTLDKKKNKEEKGLFFFGKRKSAQLWRDAYFEEDNTKQGDLVTAILNLKNPRVEDFENKSAWDMKNYLIANPSKLTKEGKSLLNTTFNKVDNNKAVIYANYLADGEKALKEILDTIARLHIYENFNSNNRKKELLREPVSGLTKLKSIIEDDLKKGISIEQQVKNKIKELSDFSFYNFLETLLKLTDKGAELNEKVSKDFKYKKLSSDIKRQIEEDKKRKLKLIEELKESGVENYNAILSGYALKSVLEEVEVKISEESIFNNLSKHYRNLLKTQIKEIKENFFIGELSKKGNPTDRNIFNRLTDDFIESFINEGQESITVQFLKDLSNETSINSKTQNLVREIERRLNILKNKKNGHYLMTVLNLKQYNEKVKDFPSNLKENQDGLIATNVDEFYVGRDNQYAVFEPEQIHIIGSKEDIKKAKEFLNNIKYQKPTNEIREVIKKELLQNNTKTDNQQNITFNGFLNQKSQIENSLNFFDEFLNSNNLQAKENIDLIKPKIEVLNELNQKLEALNNIFEFKKINGKTKLVYKNNNAIITTEQAKEIIANSIFENNIPLNINQSFNVNLNVSLENKLKTLYPQIQLTYTSLDGDLKGFADIEAMAVLVDTLKASNDTLPHEYAHHYIHWYIDTPIVQQAIKLWGSVEALVQAIGEQAVKQNGEAWGWWKKFSNWVLNLLGKEDIKNALTDAFLSGIELSATKNMSAGKYNQRLATPIGSVVSNINLRKANLKAFNTNNTDPKIKRLVELRIEELNNNIDTLVDRDFGNSPEALKKVGVNQLEIANSILDKVEITGDELYYASSIITNWKFQNSKLFLTDSILDNKDSDYYKTIEELSLIAENLSLKLEKALIKYASTIVDSELGDNKTTNNLLELEEIGSLRQMLLSASMSNSDLVVVVDSILKRAKRNQVITINSIFEEISKMFEIFDKNKTLKEIRKSDYDLFWQKDESKNYTGRITGMFSAKWDASVENFEYRLKRLWVDYITGKISKETYKKSIGKLYSNRARQTILIDYRFLLPGSTFKSDLKNYKFDKASYIQYLKTELGEDLANYFIEEANKLYTDFINERDSYFLEVDEDDTITDKDAVKRLWLNKFDPITVLNYRFGNLENEDHNVKSEKFLLRIPRKKIGNIETNYYDENYIKIAQNPELQAFYLQYTSLMNRLMNMLPINISETLPKNYLAVVTKDIVEKMSGLDVKHKIVTFSKEIFNFYEHEIRELNSKPESVRVLRNPSTGEVEKLPKVRFIGNFDSIKHSRDLEKILRLFALNAVNYDYMIKVRNTVESLYTFAESTVTPEIGVGGQITVNQKNQPNVIKKGAKRQLDLLRFNIDALLYDERTNKPLVSDKPIFSGRAIIDDSVKEIEKIKSIILKREFKFKNKIKKYELAREIELLRDELDAKLEKDLEDVVIEEEAEIIKDIYAKRMSILEDKYRELGGKRLVYSNVGEFLMRVTQLKGMGLNLTAGIANVLYGFSSNLNHASGNIEFGIRDLFKAIRLFIKSLKKPNSKYYNIIKKLDILFEVVDTRYDKEYSNENTKKLTFVDPYIIQNKTEYFNQSIPVIARLLKNKITLANGKVVSLYDIFKDDGEIDYSLLTEEDKVKWSTNLEYNTKNEYTKLRDSAIQLNTYLHGNYDPQSPILLKKSILGRMLMMFRSWVPMGFASRFLDERYDNQLGRVIKGRWVTYGDLGFVDSLQLLLKRSVIWNSEEYKQIILDKGLKELDAENMQKNFNEILIVLALNALMLMLRWSIDDDDDEDKTFRDYATMVLINQLFRAEQDVWFYINPGVMYDITRDPIPVTKTITDVIKAVDGTYKYYTKPDYRGTHPSYKWSKTVPFINQIPKMQYMAETDLKEVL